MRVALRRVYCKGGNVHAVRLEADRNVVGCGRLDQLLASLLLSNGFAIGTQRVATAAKGQMTRPLSVAANGPLSPQVPAALLKTESRARTTQRGGGCCSTQGQQRYENPCYPGDGQSSPHTAV